MPRELAQRFHVFYVECQYASHLRTRPPTEMDSLTLKLID